MKKSIWNNRSFIFYLIGQTVSSLGDGFYLIAFMWLSLQVSGGRGIVLGGVFSIYTLGEIIFGFLAGPLVDRLNKKILLVVVDIIRGAIIFLLYLLVNLKIATVGYLYMITIAFSVFSPIFHRCEFAIIPQILEKNDLLSANGILSGIKRLMQIIAPALGGLFIGIFGMESCFLFDAGSFIFSSMCIMLIVLRSSAGIKKGVSIKCFISDFRNGYHYLIGSSFLVTLAIYAACINFFGGPIFPLLPLISQNTGLGPSGYGIMMAALSGGLIASSLIIGFVERYLKRIPMVLIGLIISATAILLMPFGLGIVLMVFSAALLGVGLNFSNLPIITLFQERVPQDRIGVVSSFTFTIAQIAMPVSMALSGFLVEIFSLRIIFIAISMILIIGALIGFILPQLKDEENIMDNENADSELIA